MDLVRILAALAALPLALGALVAAAAAQGGRISARLDILTHFAPLYLAAALAALILGLAAPRSGRPLLLVVAGLGVVAAGALVAPEIAAPRQDATAPPGAPGQIRIVQFNAWGGNPTPDAAVAWILAQNPDFIVLEEGGRLRDRLRAQGFEGDCLNCGAIILSRARSVRSYAEPIRDGRLSYLAASTFRDDLGEFTIIGVHRYWPVRFREDRAQTRDLLAYVASLQKGRLILAGDFNSTPWSFARRREDRELGLIRRTRALFTWPAAKLSHNRLPALFPILPIDHVYAGPEWATVSVTRGPALGSDHYPVVVTLAPRRSGAT
jgi:endonuclease/exonuclease/phosphatase (EEP) superfamily protein YafD